MTGTILTIIFLLIIFYISCDLIEPRTRLVNECPKNKNETIQASKKLRCEKDEHNNSQYLCLPHVNKTSFVEFCFNGTMGIWEKGNCLETDDGKITLHNCSNFLDGCPDEFIFDYEFYKYPACQNISTEFLCYLLDPFCSTQSTTEETTTREENDDISISLGVATSIVSILALGICIICLVKRNYWATKDCDSGRRGVLALHLKKRSENEDSVGEEPTESLLQSTSESTYNYFSSDTDNEIRIVLLGKTGVGKSATGNSILGQKMFESKPSASSITSHCTLKSATQFGSKILIVDTPGIFDTSLTNQRTQEEIRKCIAITSPGPHAFILVLGIRRFTVEEQKSVEHFVEHFGESVYRYLIVLFTRKDDLDDADQSLQDFIKTSPENLKIIIQRCSGRVIAFNNKLTGEKNLEQAHELIDMIFKNIENNGGKFYTNELYEDAEKRLKKREREIIIETEKEREKELKAAEKFYHVEDIHNAFSAELEKLKEERVKGKLSMEEFEKKRTEAEDKQFLNFLSFLKEQNKIVQEKYEKKSKSTRNKLRNNIEQSVGVFDFIHV